MHLISFVLKNKFTSLKWVADFRDPWTNIDFYEKLMLTKWADNKHHKQELSVLQHADKVVSVGQTMSNEFLAMYQRSGGKDLTKFKVITNGFDDDDLKVGIVIKDKKFSIAHIGTLVKDRNPQAVWKVLKKIAQETEKFKDHLDSKLVGQIDFFVKLYLI